jgi:hypothetical protein
MIRQSRQGPISDVIHHYYLHLVVQLVRLDLDLQVATVLACLVESIVPIIDCVCDFPLLS